MIALQVNVFHAHFLLNWVLVFVLMILVAKVSVPNLAAVCLKNTLLSIEETNVHPLTVISMKTLLLPDAEIVHKDIS